MTQKKKTEIEVDEIDDLTQAEIDQRVAQTRELAAQILGLWPGLVRLTENERKTSVGKSLANLSAPLGALFQVIAPAGKPTPAIASAFDVLGAQDQGKDPDRFEAELLARRLYRAEAEQTVVELFDDLSRHFADDVLSTGEMVIGPGLLALELARSVAKAKPEFGSLLAPVLDAFRNLTKQARKRRENKQPPTATPPGTPAGTPTPSTPTTLTGTPSGTNAT